MSFRVGQERGRKGWYVYVDRPKALRLRRGGKTARRKAGETREAALRNALRIEAELIKQWTEEADQSPFKAAKEASTNLGIRLDVALDEAYGEQTTSVKTASGSCLALRIQLICRSKGLKSS